MVSSGKSRCFLTATVFKVWCQYSSSFQKVVQGMASTQLCQCNTACVRLLVQFQFKTLLFFSRGSHSCALILHEVFSCFSLAVLDIACTLVDFCFTMTEIAVDFSVYCLKWHTFKKANSSRTLEVYFIALPQFTPVFVFGNQANFLLL